jgi:hypothetical protein
MKQLYLVFAAVLAACNTTNSNPPNASVVAVKPLRAGVASYQTFAFGTANAPSTGFEVTPRSIEVQRKVTELVETTLEKRGYQRDANSPDLVVKISAGSGTLRHQDVGRQAQVTLQPRGYISIDVYDAELGTSVWHGSGQADIDPDKIDDALLARAVEEILEQFPGRGQSQQAMGSAN